MSSNKIITGALPIGSIIDTGSERYVVEEVLGSGGFGITYKVTRLSDGASLAMKEYFPSTLCERSEDDHTVAFLKTNALKFEEGVKNFITEAKRLEKQNIFHPNLISVEEVFRANSTAYYTMEFIEGDNLRQYIRRHGNKPLEVAQALSVLRPILQGVALIHNKNLAHYDIKHDNIILSSDRDGAFRPVLIDFGQAKHYDRKGNATSTLTNAGFSDGFSPPEQYQGLDKFTPQADVYALSATLLYLLTAKMPPKSSEISTVEVVNRLGERIPVDIQEAIIKGLLKNKEDRTQSVEQLAKDLGLDISFTDNDSNLTHLLDTGKKKRKKISLKKPAISNNVLLIAGGCLVIAAIITLGIIFGSKGGAEEEIAVVPEDTVAVVEEPLAVVEEPADTIPTETPVVATDDEIFAQAMKKYDLSTLLQLANRGYSKAYYPIAAIYYANKNNQKASQWAKQAIAVNANAREARALLNKIEQGPTESNASLVKNAKTIAELRILANQGVKEAYAPLSKKELDERNYDAAAKYAKMAQDAGKATAESRNVIESLKILGYYD